MAKKSWLALGLVILSFSSYGQTDIADFLKIYEASKTDAISLATAYMEPLGKSVGQGFNNGWYTSAKPHKLGGFDLSISVSGVNISSSMKTFDASKYISSNNLKIIGNPITPTVLGKDVDGPRIQAYNSDGTAIPGAEFTMPQGVNIPMVPIPIYNIGVGLPLKTEIDIRFLPQISFGDGKANLWGFGIKNEFKEFIPGFKLLPLDISAFFGYTSYTLKWNLEDIDYAQNGFNDQELKSKSYSYTARLLVSKSIPFLTVYGALGYNGGTTNFDMNGHYEVYTSDIALVPTKFIDPFSLKYNVGNFVFNAGLRLKFGFFMLYGDYTHSEYSMYSAGFGFTFR